jgi:hypothetical protein
VSLARLASTITRLGGGPVTITRPGAPTLDAGRVVEGRSTVVTTQASVQPVSGRELLRLPEGLRTRELVAVYSPVELRTANATSGALADQVAYGGATYEVQLVEDWSRLGGYWRGIAAKRGA